MNGRVKISQSLIFAQNTSSCTRTNQKHEVLILRFMNQEESDLKLILTDVSVRCMRFRISQEYCNHCTSGLLYHILTDIKH